VTAVVQSDITLRDGTPVHIRPIRPEDDHVLVELFQHLSAQSIYQRFFTAMPELTPGMARYLSNVNATNRLALVAESAGELIGVGRYERTSDPGLVELALLVADAWQGRGLGRILLREVLRAADANGIHRFRADVLAENRRMLRLLAEECEIKERKTEAGITTLIISQRQSVRGSDPAHP
jgi:RimJ/RimL family protein N-acetyltransferase